MSRKGFDQSVADFGHAIGALSRRVRAQAASHDLSLTEASVLARLSRSGPATTAELARLEGVRPQSMGATVAALEERGLLERTPHPTDGRQVNIALTARGVALRKIVGDAKRTWLAHAISHLGEEERDTLFAASGIIERLVTGEQP
jgi:DNA-binding MarR family transcriptional regulator